MSTFVLPSGEELLITNWFDVDGDEIDGPEDAHQFVAGPDRNGGWHVVQMSDVMAVERSVRH